MGGRSSREGEAPAEPRALVRACVVTEYPTQPRPHGRGYVCDGFERPAFSTMFRDKEYIRTKEGLLFNVLGYEHPPGRVACHLRYVENEKRSDSYQQAVTFLLAKHPAYVDSGFISVATEDIVECFRPDESLRGIFDNEHRSSVQSSAVELTEFLSKQLLIPRESFGVTDSLCWGGAHDDSDVDLVVYDAANARKILDAEFRLFELPELTLFPQSIFVTPHEPVMEDAEFAQLCCRKNTLGYFKERRFSLRAIRARDEIPLAAEWKPVEPIQLQTRIAARDESLFFPAVYQTECGLPLTCFWMLYEGVFHVGESVEVRGMLERSELGERVVVGSLYGRDERITMGGLTM